MASEKMMKKNNTRLIATGVGAAALATATMAYNKIKSVKENKEACFDNTLEGFAPCPTCGVIIDKNQKKCYYCHSVIQTCISCGHLFNANARYCPHCGTQSDVGGKVVISGKSYQGPIREPFPTDRVHYDFCCCGTPFADKAKYCQLCGRIRPNPGESYQRNESVIKGRNIETHVHIVMQNMSIDDNAYVSNRKENRENEQTKPVQGEERNT